MNAPARVLLVEDHWMFREQLASLINERETLTVAGQADNIRDALDLCRQLKPDVAVVDISLRGASGLELIKNLKAEESLTPVLILSMHEESLYAERVLAAGGKGYLTKHEKSETLLQAIEKVVGGEVYLSEKMTAALLKRFTGASATTESVQRLADRELEVFQLIGRGRQTREIAESLGLGVSTIDTYRARIKEKLGVSSSHELQHRASQWLQDGVAAGTRR
jgi:DNA-binding NarL/FixJ family response regulator